MAFVSLAANTRKIQSLIPSGRDKIALASTSLEIRSSVPERTSR